MAKVQVERTLLVGAPPEKVFKVLADPAHHKHILPEAITRYKPESDSIVSFSVKAGFVTRDFRVETEETEPNKLFREMDLATGIITEFRLEPHEQGTLVTIAVDYEAARSFSGLMETWFAPTFLKKLYDEELIKLGRYVLIADL